MIAAAFLVFLLKSGAPAPLSADLPTATELGAGWHQLGVTEGFEGTGKISSSCRRGFALPKGAREVLAQYQSPIGSFNESLLESKNTSEAFDEFVALDEACHAKGIHMGTLNHTASGSPDRPVKPLGISKLELGSQSELRIGANHYNIFVYSAVKNGILVEWTYEGPLTISRAERLIRSTVKEL